MHTSLLPILHLNCWRDSFDYNIAWLCTRNFVFPIVSLDQAKVGIACNRKHVRFTVRLNGSAVFKEIQEV